MIPFKNIGFIFLLFCKNKHHDFCSFAAQVSTDILCTGGKISCPEPAKQTVSTGAPDTVGRRTEPLRC